MNFNRRILRVKRIMIHLDSRYLSRNWSIEFENERRNKWFNEWTKAVHGNQMQCYLHNDIAFNLTVLIWNPFFEKKILSLLNRLHRTKKKRWYFLNFFIFPNLFRLLISDFCGAMGWCSRSGKSRFLILHLKTSRLPPKETPLPPI